MFSNIKYRMRALFRRDSMDTELDEEIRAHIEREAEEYVRKGLSPDEARRMARLALGGQEQVKEACRDARDIALISMLIQDLRCAARLLRKSPRCWAWSSPLTAARQAARIDPISTLRME